VAAFVCGGVLFVLLLEKIVKRLELAQMLLLDSQQQQELPLTANHVSGDHEAASRLDAAFLIALSLSVHNAPEGLSVLHNWWTSFDNL
jgi:zinc transporter ZupT